MDAQAKGVEANIILQFFYALHHTDVVDLSVFATMKRYSSYAHSYHASEDQQHKIVNLIKLIRAIVLDSHKPGMEDSIKP